MSYQNQRYGQQGYGQRQRRRSSFSGLKLRLLIGGAIVLFSVISFLNKGEINPVTGHKQRVDLSVQEEIAQGLGAVGQMGPPSRNIRAANHVDAIGKKLVSSLEQELYQRGIKNPYPFEFHLISQQQINAFALPGGQIFMTEHLYRALADDGSPAEHEARVAGVLGHEIGHVIERHGSERMAKGSLIQGIVGAAGVAGGNRSGQQAAAYVGNIVNMKYGRNDELESDKWGVQLMILSNYHPKYLLDVMRVLEASKGSGAPPEFMSTHPSSATRIEAINELLKENVDVIEQMEQNVREQGLRRDLNLQF